MSPLHVATSGAGPDLVLLHGWAARGSIWRPLARELEDSFQVHVVDLPGYGASPACEPYALEQWVEQVSRAAPARTVVCGWSLGGLVALAWALAQPQRVERLVLIAATPCFTQRPGWEAGAPRALLDEFAAGVRRDVGATLARFAALQALNDEHASRVRRELQRIAAEDGSSDSEVLRRGLAILRDTDLRDRLDAVTQPALIVHGKRDAVTPFAAGESLARALPRARLAAIDAAGHAPFIAREARIAALIGEFLRDG